VRHRRNDRDLHPRLRTDVTCVGSSVRCYYSLPAPLSRKEMHIHIDLAAVLLGAGVRLFDHLANTPVVLGNPTVVTGVGVTHLRYPVHTS
jgi:hypothetical protein